MRLIKLTDHHGQTRNQVQWGENVSISLPEKENPRLCSEDLLHAYRTVEQALLFNPSGAGFSKPRIWEAEGDVVAEDWGKVGCFKLMTIRELPIPEWYADKERRRHVQLKFAILCAEAVLPIWTKEFPQDHRPVEAIASARRVLALEATS